MGSYTKLTGRFDLSRDITFEEIKHVNSLLCRAEFGIFRVPHGSNSASMLRFNLEYKGTDEDETLKFAKEIVTALSSIGIEVVGRIEAIHEYGEFWKVEINKEVIGLYRGVKSYEFVTKIKGNVKEVKQVSWE